MCRSCSYGFFGDVKNAELYMELFNKCGYTPKLASEKFEREKPALGFGVTHCQKSLNW